MTRAWCSRWLLAAALAPLLSAGCGTDACVSQPQLPSCAMKIVDMAMPVGPAKFADIEMDMSNKCLSGSPACHGKGNTNPLNRLQFVTGMDDANYQLLITDMLIDTMSPATSRLLTQPQDPTHMGGVIFASTSDATYQKWLKWITAGAPK